MLLRFRKCHHEGIGSHGATGDCEKSSEKKDRTLLSLNL